MAVVYRSIVETDITVATASPVVTKPAGVVTGDMMLMFVVTNTAANVSAVAGWALCGAEVDNGTDSTTALLWKIAAADEPPTWTMTNMFDATETADFVVIAYSGANAVHKVGTQASLGVTSPGTLSGPSVTPTVDGCMIVQFAGCDPGTGTYAGTPDTSPVGVQRWDAKNAAADSAEYIFIQEYRQGVAGAIALDVTDLATDTYGYHQVALSPTPLTETVTLTESVYTGRKILTETASLSHNVLNLAGIVLWEAISLADPTLTATKTAGKSATPTETVVLTDTISNQKNYKRTLTETSTLTKSVLKGTGRALTSTMTLADGTVLLGPARVFSSTVTLTEGLTKGEGRVLTSSVTLTESVTKQGTYGRTLTETAVLADSIRYGNAVNLTETVALADVFARQLALERTLTEAVALTDPTVGTEKSGSHAYDTSPVETILLTDDTLSLVGIGLWETSALSDALLRDTGRVLVSTIALADTVATQTSGKVNLPETVSLSDVLVLGRTAARTLSEGTTLSDSRRLDIGRVFVSSVSLSDSTQKDTRRVLVSSLVLTDSTRKDVAIVLVEASLLSDVLSTGKSIVASETANLSDSLVLSRTAARTLVEAATLTDSVQRGISRAIVSTLTVGAPPSSLSDSAETKGGTFGVTYLVPEAGQSFLGDGKTLRVASFNIGNNAPGVGSVYAKLYAHSGTYGTTGVPTGSALATSLPTYIPDSGSNWIDFPFPVGFVLESGTPYFVVVVVEGGASIGIGALSSHGGNGAYYEDGVGWLPYGGGGYDYQFRVYTEDTVRKQTARTLIETSTLSDTLSTGKTIALPETISLADSLVRGLAAQRVLVEATTLADTFSSGKSVSLVETLGLADTLLRARAAARTFVETGSLTDVLVLARTAARTFTEAATLADAPATTTLNGGAYVRTWTETLVLDHAVLNLAGIELRETATLADTLTLPGYKTLTETVTLTDPAVTTVQTPAHYTKELTDAAVLTDPQLIRGRIYSETVTLSDSITLPGAKSTTRTEALSLTDSLTLAKALARTLTEGASLADSKRFDTTRALTSTVTLADTLTKGRTATRTLLETVALADSLATQTGDQANLSETALLTDSLARVVNVARGPVETAALADQVRKNTARNLPAETVSLTGALTLVKGLGRTLTETVLLTDSLASQTGNQANLPETVVLSDSLTLGRTAARTFVEAATLSHTISAAKGGGADLPQPLVLTDTLRKDVTRTLVESATLSGTVRFDTARTLSDSVALGGLFNASKTGEANSIDVLQLGDACQKDISRTLTETVALSDSRSRDISREIQESAVLADRLAQLAGGDRLELAETIVLTDSLIQPGIYVEPVAHFGDQYHTSLTGSQYHTSLTGSQYHTLLSEDWGRMPRFRYVKAAEDDLVYFFNISEGTEPVSWLWDFGDGSETSSERDLARPHAYPFGAHAYLVTLTAYSDGGILTTTATINFVWGLARSGYSS